MKKMILATISLLFMATAIFAQSPKTTELSETARAQTDKLAAKYQLDAQQIPKMEQAQQLKVTNLASLESLKTTNPTKYRAKMKNLYEGSRGSVALILNTKAQKEIYRQMLVEIREKKAVATRDLTAKKASKAEIESAMLEIEAAY